MSCGGLRGLLEKMMKYDPNERINSVDALADKWLAEGACTSTQLEQVLRPVPRKDVNDLQAREMIRVQQHVDEVVMFMVDEYRLLHADLRDASGRQAGPSRERVEEDIAVSRFCRNLANCMTKNNGGYVSSIAALVREASATDGQTNTQHKRTRSNY